MFATKVAAEAYNPSPDPAPAYLILAGYYTVGDGGWSLYKKIATPSPAKAWHLQIAEGSWYEYAPDKDGINALALGVRASGNSGHAASNTTALQAAIDAAAALNPPYGVGRLILPAGLIYFNGVLNITTAIMITGAGSGYTDYGGDNINATWLYQLHATADGIKVVTQQPVVLKDFKIEMARTALAGTCIRVIGGPGSPPTPNALNNMTEIRNVTTIGGRYGMSLLAARMYLIDHPVVTAFGVDGILMQSTDADGDLGAFLITGGHIIGPIPGPGQACIRMGTQAGQIIGTTITGCADGISFDVSQNSGTLMLDDLSIEDQSVSGIHVRQLTAGKFFSNICINDVEFMIPYVSPNYGSAIVFEQGVEPDYIRNFSITNCKINPLYANQTASYLVNIQGGTNGIIANNNIDSPSPNSTGIIVGGNAVNIAVLDNMITRVTSKYNLSSAVTVRDHINNLIVSELGAWADGSMAYVSDGTPNVCPLTGSSNGAIAKRLNSVWRSD